jgi:bacteriocin biosynthesis cyclodehydratase domain-containing protein
VSPNRHQNVNRRRPRFALPFTIVPGTDRVRLVAGEDFRYTLSAPGLEDWLPQLLEKLDGKNTIECLLEKFPRARRAPATRILERLYGERVLVNGPVADAHLPAVHRLAIEGSGPIARRLAEAAKENTGNGDEDPVLSVLVQDRLDYAEALDFNGHALAGSHPWLWVTCGPLTRGYVSPVYLPHAGPCLACLVETFRSLSPVPEIYDDLIAHSRKGQPLEPIPFPAEATEILIQLTLAKRAALSEEIPPALLYRLHVLEASSLEVTTHRVFVDPECSSCESPR